METDSFSLSASDPIVLRSGRVGLWVPAASGFVLLWPPAVAPCRHSPPGGRQPGRGTFTPFMLLTVPHAEDGVLALCLRASESLCWNEGRPRSGGYAGKMERGDRPEHGGNHSASLVRLVLRAGGQGTLTHRIGPSCRMPRSVPWLLRVTPRLRVPPQAAASAGYPCPYVFLDRMTGFAG